MHVASAFDWTGKLIKTNQSGAKFVFELAYLRIKITMPKRAFHS